MSGRYWFNVMAWCDWISVTLLLIYGSRGMWFCMEKFSDMLYSVLVWDSSKSLIVDNGWFWKPLTSPFFGATGWMHRLPINRKHIRLEDWESEGLDAHKPRTENFDTFIEGSPNIFRENRVGIYLHQRGRENWRVGWDCFRWHHAGWQNGYKCWCRWGLYLLLNFLCRQNAQLASFTR